MQTLVRTGFCTHWTTPLLVASLLLVAMPGAPSSCGVDVSEISQKGNSPLTWGDMGLHLTVIVHLTQGHTNSFD